VHVAITGATGMIGSALSSRLRADGHRVTAVSRSPGPDTIVWDPAAGRLDPAGLGGVDGVVHLAAEPIRPRRWTAKTKERIRSSRILGTGLLARTLAELPRPPGVLVSISGITYYGDRGDALLTEDDPAGEQFLAQVCVEWEGAADPARDAGIRVVHPRVGIVQSRDATQLKLQLPLYHLGLGGPLGSGRQFWSWITLHDLVGVLVHALVDDRVEGPVNTVAPHPVRQAEYARTLAGLLGRPAVVPVPAFGPRLVFGEMADEMIFTSTRADASRITQLGYTFRHPTLTEGLRAVLGLAGA
jgi:uncharacterized protein